MKESALSLIEEGLLGILVSFVLGIILIPMSISSYFRPYPPHKDYWGCYDKTEKEYKEELKAFWLKTQIPIIFTTIAVIIAIIAATTWAIQCLDGSPKTTAVIAIVLASLSLVMNIVTVVTKIALE